MDEKLKIIETSADGYKKLPKDKQMFILGYMQGVLHTRQDKAQQQDKEIPVA